VPADGPAASHVIAFRRGSPVQGGPVQAGPVPGGPVPGGPVPGGPVQGGAVTVATRLPAGLRQAGGWKDTSLRLPGRQWRDVLTGTRHDTDRPLLADLTATLPVALLIEVR
jgi:hypothetical protein